MQYALHVGCQLLAQLVRDGEFAERGFDELVEAFVGLEGEHVRLCGLRIRELLVTTWHAPELNRSKHRWFCGRCCRRCSDWNFWGTDCVSGGGCW